MHILKGDVPSCAPGRILAMRASALSIKSGPPSRRSKPGDKVLVSCISSCGQCAYCRKTDVFALHDGGWILGNTSTARKPTLSAFPMPKTASTPFPRRGRRSAGDAQRHPADGLRMRRAERKSSARQHRGDRRLWTDWPRCPSDCPVLRPAEIIMIDLDDNRLKVAKRLGATATINSHDGKRGREAMNMTGSAAWTRPSRRSAFRPRSNCARTSLRRAARSPTSACTGKRPTSSRKTMGPQHRHNHAAGRYPPHTHAAQSSRLQQN